MRYFQAAFLDHWNQLALWGGVGFAFVTGIPTVVLPILIAGELVYLTVLASNPKFRKAIDAADAARARLGNASSAEKTVEAVLAQLPRRQVERFEALRERCRELYQIAEGIRGPHGSATPTLNALQTDGLDRLLWIYLRLLFTQYQLDRFLRKTNEPTIAEEIRRVEQQLQSLGSAKDERTEKMRTALTDNLFTYRTRLNNYGKARDNAQQVQLEIERLENKIQSLSELAVNRQEPGALTTKVDEVATSMMNTEKTMSDLDFLTGLQADQDHTPELMKREKVRIPQ